MTMFRSSLLSGRYIPFARLSERRTQITLGEIPFRNFVYLFGGSTSSRFNGARNLIPQNQVHLPVVVFHCNVRSLFQVERGDSQMQEEHACLT